MTMAISLGRGFGDLSKSKLNRPERLRTDVNANLFLYMIFLDDELSNQSKKALYNSVFNVFSVNPFLYMLFFHHPPAIIAYK